MPAPKERDRSGIRVTNWFYGCEAFGGAPVPLKKEAEESDVEATADAYQIALDLITQNPKISAPTLLNLMKSKGIEFRIKQEADSISSQPAGIVTPKEADKFKPVGMSFRETCKFIEKTAPDVEGFGTTRFRVALIQEGLGNLKDGFYYTKEALQSAIPIFDGKKCYADHPDSIEEQTRPERSVRDVIGHFENIALEESGEGEAMLTADLVLLPDAPFEWARALVRHAVDYSSKYPDKSFIGLSINASGDADAVSLDSFVRETNVPKGAMPKIDRARQEGLENIRVVKSIRDAVSADIVTEPGAKGKVLEMLERDKAMAKKLKEEEAKKEAKKKEADEMGADHEKKQEMGDHDDEAKDKELIAEMLRKHLGDQDVENEEACKYAKEAFEAYKEMGYEPKAAMEATGHAMKLAKHMAAKKSKEADEMDKAKESKEAEVKHEEGVPVIDDHKKKESEILTLKGENAALKEKLAKIELDAYVDKKLSESKVRREYTKVLKERLVSAKSEKEVDEKVALFLEGYKSGMGSEADAFSFIQPEKAVSDASHGKVSLADCFND